MRKFFTPILFLLAALLFIGNASAQTVIETVLIDEDFDDNILDPNLIIGEPYGQLSTQYQNSQYWEVDFGNHFSQNFSLFRVDDNFLSGYDSVQIFFDLVTLNPPFQTNCYNGILELSANSFQYFPMQNLQIGRQSDFQFDHTVNCNESGNEITLTDPNPISIISGMRISMLNIIGDFPQGQFCPDILCACEALFPDDDMMRSMCFSELSMPNPQTSEKLGIDNLKIIGYKTDVTTNLTSKNAKNKTLVMVTNILGQEVKQQNSGEIYLYHYSNGNVEKRMIAE